MSADQFQSMGFVEEDASFSPEMLCKIALTRYGQGGITTLDYDGARSTVRDVGKEHKMKILAKAAADVPLSGLSAQLAEMAKVDPKDETVET